MLPVSQRLRRSTDIVTAVRHGRVAHTPYVRAFIHARPTPLKIACVVGKKVSRQAVIRHRYQRWLRECARELLPHLPPTGDLVLVALPAIATLSHRHELAASLTDLPARLDKALQSRKN